VDTIDQVFADELDRVTVQLDGQMMPSAPQPFVLFPGSFNPVHEGHLLLARVAGELRQQPLAFEISGPKYYGDEELRMHMALEEIANTGSFWLPCASTRRGAYAS
jgi:nicotinic acid mononucleotide adenylyltransferase